MRERMKKKKNMIIGGLLALIFLMSVGYAAFASNLTINGTANTSSWIIKITNIREKTHTGGADTVSTSYTDLSASFSSTLTKPGDSVTYEVTVENQGNIDASLKEVTKTFTNNTYIDVTYSGLVKGQMLYKQGQAGSSAVMEVTVTFKDIEIESLTETITSNITISLDFEQEGNNVDTTTKYLVTYDSDGGSAVESRYVLWDEYGIDNTEVPRKVGYSFVHWETSSHVDARPERNYAFLAQDPSLEGITLYAKWGPKMYTVHFDTQGSEDTVVDRYLAWTEYNFATENPTKQHYTFNGWYSKVNGKGVKVDTTTTIGNIIKNQYGKNTDIAGGTNGDEVTIYAYYLPNDFTIKYNQGLGVNESSVILPMKTQTVKWDSTNISHPIPIREGYTFKGWNTSMLGNGKNVTDGMLLSDFVSGNKDTITIYACWAKNS